MRRVYCALLILFISSYVLKAQSTDEIRANSEEYLSGEGWGESLKAADNAALQDLISKISIAVESQFENIEEEMSDQNGVDSHSACRSVVNTYSQATARIRAFEQAMRESAAAQKHAEMVSDFIKEGFELAR